MTSNAALSLAIKTLYEMRRKYAVNHNLYVQYNGKTDWVKGAHEKYIEITQAIEALEKMKSRQYTLPGMK